MRYCGVVEIRDAYAEALRLFRITDEMEYFAMMNRWY